MIWDNLSLSLSPGQASTVLASAGMPVAPVARAAATASGRAQRGLGISEIFNFELIETPWYHALGTWHALVCLSRLASAINASRAAYAPQVALSPIASNWSAAGRRMGTMPFSLPPHWQGPPQGGQATHHAALARL